MELIKLLDALVAKDDALLPASRLITLDTATFLVGLLQDLSATFSSSGMWNNRWQLTERPEFEAFMFLVQLFAAASSLVETGMRETLTEAGLLRVVLGATFLLASRHKLTSSRRSEGAAKNGTLRERGRTGLL